MFSNDNTTTEILFTEFQCQTRRLGGTVIDTFHRDARLFVRSVLPEVEEVRSRDGMQGGLAMRATESDVWLHPYLFRLVCRNGAIIAETLETVHLEYIDAWSPEEIRERVAEAFAVCCGREVFQDNIRRVRTVALAKADQMLALMPFLAKLTDTADSSMMAAIVDQLSQDRDHTPFGLANAITAVARDTADPDLRWRMEEIGAGILTGRLWDPPAMSQSRRLTAALVG